MNRSFQFRVWVVILMLLATLVPAAAAQNSEFADKPEHVVMIMLDGFRPDYFGMYNLPNMESLIEKGTWVANARSVFPSITTANQTSFVTGAWPATTGIPNNSRYDRQKDQVIGPLRDNKAVTIAEVFRQAGLSTATVNHFMLENRGVDRYYNGGALQVAGVIKRDKPNLMVYYNAHTDSVGHSYGPFSTEMRKTAEAADAEVGEIIAALKEAGIYHKTLIVVASDHGMGINYSRSVSPNPREIMQNLKLKVATRNEEINDDTEVVFLQYGSSFIYLRDGKVSDERYKELVNALQQIDHARLLLPEDIRELNADPERVGDLVLVPEQGYSIFSGDDRSGIHGRPEEEQCTIFFAGAGIKPRNVIREASIVDIVPTILHLFGLSAPDTVDGKVLREVMNVPAWKLKLTTVGDYLPMDVTASSAREGYDAAQALDNDPSTFWVTDAFKSVDEFQPQHITVDFGSPKIIKSVEFVSRNFRKSIAPKEFAVESSQDGITFSMVFEGEMPPLKNGESFLIDLPAPIQTRFIRFYVKSAHAPNLQVAELRFWAQ